MKQYCRYCTNCIYGDVVYCDENKKVLSEKSAKTVNQCKNFQFINIDVFGENLNGYKPRTKNENVPLENQLKMGENYEIRSR